MAQTYAYKVRDKAGKLVQGTLEAESTALVVTKLRQMGYVPISIDAKSDVSMKMELHLPGVAPRVKPNELALFSRQFATMINAGVTLLRSLSILGEQTESKVLAQILHQVRQDIQGGSSLSSALAKHPKSFPQLYVAMVKAGETGGVLDSVLLSLSTTIEKQVELRRKIRSAMTYPIAVLSMVLLILAAMLIFIVPIFKKMYSSLGGTLPLPTRILIGVSDWSVKLLPVIVVLGIVGVFLLRKWIKTPTGKAAWDGFRLKIPIFGRLFHKTALSRFCSTLATLLRAGVPILEALEITSDVVNCVPVARAILDVEQGVKSGESLAGPLAAHPIFPPMAVQMLAVGEETGSIDTLLEKLAGFYDQEIEATVDALTSLLEPMLIGVLGTGVGSMIISLYLPMFNIVKLIKN
jgi:type IV pilus assembly protein PilC